MCQDCLTIEKDLEKLKREIENLSKDELKRIVIDCMRIIIENDLLDLE